MSTPATFWLSALLLLTLVFANRFLPKTRFVRLSKAVSLLSFGVGVMLLAMFILSFIYVIRVGFPE